MPEQKEWLVRVAPLRQPIIEEAREKIKKQANIKNIQNPELFERLARFYVENKV